MRFKEWASTLKARKGRMLPLEAFDIILRYRDPGYSSVYSFREEDARKLLDEESSVGMNRFEVGADELLIDIDCGEDGLREVGRVLEKNDLKFDVWDSGGKGYHISIPHDFVSDKRLPYSHKAAITALLGQTVARIDLTLYQHGRLISLPGRLHPITKRKKSFLFSSPGARTLGAISIIEEPPKFQVNFSMSGWSSLSESFLRLSDLAQNEPDVGQRHVKIWSVSKSLAESGLDYDTVLTLLSKVNDSWITQKKPLELEQAVKSAFKNMTDS